MFITSFLHLNKGFWLFWGKLQSDFCKNLTEAYGMYEYFLANILS